VLHFYHMSVPMQNFIACLGMILFIIMVVPTTWLLERHGLRIAVSIKKKRSPGPMFSRLPNQNLNRY
jgi:hypothetical protein